MEGKEMIDKLTLRNFKGFRELRDLKIKPITILCGTNSCGKSSILQSILLVKQTLESQNPNQTLLLNGRFVHLGTFDNCIFQKNLDNNVEFEFTIKFKSIDLITQGNRRKLFPVSFFMKRHVFGNVKVSNKDDEYCVYYKISLGATKETFFQSLSKPIRVNEMECKFSIITADKNIIQGPSVTIKHEQSNSYCIKWENIQDEDNKEGEIRAEVEFGRMFPMAFGIRETPSRQIPFILRWLPNLFLSIFASYTYIGPLREEPSRRYIYEDEVVEIGNKGENAAYIYLTKQDEVIHKHYFFDNRHKIFVQKEKIRLSDAVLEWLNLMNIQNLKPETVQDIIQITLNSSCSESTRVNIADVGFGVSQIFPIILEGLRMPSKHTLLLEQPEIHLHPNLQMQMADYFISLALSNKKVIVETHSDHVVNRLVRRIIEDTNGKLKELIGIYFITPTQNGATYEEICIDDKFGIVNWPKDFCDQTATEQEKIILAGINKRKKASKGEEKE